jgi:TonB family protein
MRPRLRSLCLLTLSSLALGQNPDSSLPELPKDPRAMLSAAKPLYDYSESMLKPWRLIGTYQLFDEAGNPSQEGKYEFWWEKPGLYRSTWSRNGGTQTEWHSVDGKSWRQSSGDRLFYFEHALQDFLLQPIPDPSALDQAGFEIKSTQLEVNNFRLPCAEIKAKPELKQKSTFVPHAQGEDYCFDASKPVLRIEQLFGSIYAQFNLLTVRQGRILPREIIIADRRQKLLSLKVETIDDLGEVPAMEPPADAVPYPSADKPAIQKLIDKVAPIYPPGAKMEGIAGTVILDVMIGKDGKVGDMRVLSTRSPMLVPASKYAVSQWRYSPYLSDGKAQEVNTIINVIFSLGH